MTLQLCLLILKRKNEQIQLKLCFHEFHQFWLNCNIYEKKIIIKINASQELSFIPPLGQILLLNSVCTWYMVYFLGQFY